jgi:hypothetical protein
VIEYQNEASPRNFMDAPCVKPSARSGMFFAWCDMLVRKKMHFGAILSIVVQHTLSICNES